ncbi:hypothetical protein DFH08DRAFT_840132 [Mycena albidolilacea]|uniref:F-box domain-containing protein n=1 Tax=Mycena albidolilacea TaxID=1033008 RepID=A0AAD7AQG6_9AGAR|nr:hypothetical protein DFH08DRAFT_840132 [Mycena albidolilacea]
MVINFLMRELSHRARIGVSQVIPSSRFLKGTVGFDSTESNLRAFVVSLETPMSGQEGTNPFSEQENSGVSLKEPRLPLEICLLIVNSARNNKKTVKTLSLVCKSWIGITREILFVTPGAKTDAYENHMRRSLPLVAGSCSVRLCCRAMSNRSQFWTTRTAPSFRTSK